MLFACQLYVIQAGALTFLIAFQSQFQKQYELQKIIDFFYSW